MIRLNYIKKKKKKNYSTVQVCRQHERHMAQDTCAADVSFHVNIKRTLFEFLCVYVKVATKRNELSCCFNKNL